MEINELLQEVKCRTRKLEQAMSDNDPQAVVLAHYLVKASQRLSQHVAAKHKQQYLKQV